MIVSGRTRCATFRAPRTRCNPCVVYCSRPWKSSGPLGRDCSFRWRLRRFPAGCDPHADRHIARPSHRSARFKIRKRLWNIEEQEERWLVDFEWPQRWAIIETLTHVNADYARLRLTCYILASLNGDAQKWFGLLHPDYLTTFGIFHGIRPTILSGKESNGQCWNRERKQKQSMHNL